MRLDFDKIIDFIPVYDEELFKDFSLKLLGYFEYETARLENYAHTSVWLPSEVADPIISMIRKLDTLSYSRLFDNKCVYIFENTTLFGNKRIAMQYHDGKVRFGSWDDVVKYNGHPL